MTGSSKWIGISYNGLNQIRAIVINIPFAHYPSSCIINIMILSVIGLVIKKEAS